MIRFVNCVRLQKSVYLTAFKCKTAVRKLILRDTWRTWASGLSFGEWLLLENYRTQTVTTRKFQVDRVVRPYLKRGLKVQRRGKNFLNLVMLRIYLPNLTEGELIHSARRWKKWNRKLKLTSRTQPPVLS